MGLHPWMVVVVGFLLWLTADVIVGIYRRRIVRGSMILGSPPVGVSDKQAAYMIMPGSVHVLLIAGWLTMIGGAAWFAWTLLA